MAQCAEVKSVAQKIPAELDSVAVILANVPSAAAILQLVALWVLSAIFKGSYASYRGIHLYCKCRPFR